MYRQEKHFTFTISRFKIVEESNWKISFLINIKNPSTKSNHDARDQNQNWKNSKNNGYIDLANERWSPNRLVTDSNALDLAAKKSLLNLTFVTKNPIRNDPKCHQPMSAMCHQPMSAMCHQHKFVTNMNIAKLRACYLLRLKKECNVNKI